MTPIASVSLINKTRRSREFDNIPSAGVPLSRLGPVRPGFPLGAELPGHGDDAGHDDAGDQGVGSPVAGLRVPTTGRGPDVLWVAVEEGNGGKVRIRCDLGWCVRLWSGREREVVNLRDFSAAALGSIVSTALSV